MHAAADIDRHVPNVILLQENEGKPIVFCVHGVDGGIGAYLPLAEAIGCLAQTYGITSLDLRGKMPLKPSMREIAVDYVQRIQQIQHQGPYRLVGWSSGGWVVFQMACELVERGAEVASVCLLDSRRPPQDATMDLPLSARHNVAIPAEDKSKLMWWRFLSHYTLDKEATGIPASFWSEGDSEKCRFILRHARDANKFIGRSALQGVRTENDVMYMRDIVSTQFDAFIGYEPPLYPGPLHVFVAVENPASRAMIEAEEFWRSRVGGALGLHQIAGDHFAPLRHPAVRDVAAVICDEGMG